MVAAPRVPFLAGGASLIFNQPIAGSNPNDYDFKTQVYLEAGGGTLFNFVRASSNAMPGSGSYVSVELVIPTNYVPTYPTSYYSTFALPVPMQLNINQRVNGTITQLGSTTVSAANEYYLRTVGVGANLWVYIENAAQNSTVLVWQGSVGIATGQPGVGGYGLPVNDLFIQADIEPRDTVAPTPVNPQTVASYLTPNSVSLQWQGTLDNSGGVGVAGYEVLRNGTSLGFGDGAAFADETTQPSTAYTYQISAMDYDGNVSAPATVALTTPPAQGMDSRRVGVRPSGSYWGGAGEQIDTLSGNVNFSIPLIKPQGRTGWTVPVGLSYNSQNWRRDAGGVDWQLGHDVGYGFGWKLLIGSITPFYTGAWGSIDHYTYTDSSGAEYRLDVNNAGVWSSSQDVYIWFDSNVDLLYFGNGTFWNMGCTSSGTEPDAGTMYPTKIQDPIGNQVLIYYLGTASARISQIIDARGSYIFSFNADSPIPHFTGVTNTIGTAEKYTLTYQAGPFGPPFGSDPAYAGATSTYLSSITVPVTNTPYGFTYDSTNSGELAEVSFPYGGHIRWGYQTFSFADGATWREVNQRYLAADSAGMTEWPYTITRSDYSTLPPASVTLHSDMTVVDASGVGAKTWTFSTQASGVPAWKLGMSAQFNELSGAGGSVLRSSAFTWSQNASGSPYISSTLTTSDPGTSNQQVARADQTQDHYGNVTQSVEYPYNNTTTPLRTYNSTFVNGANYLAAHMVKVPLSTTLTFTDPTTNNPVTKTLVTNYYNGTCPSNTQGMQCPALSPPPYAYGWIAPSGLSVLAPSYIGLPTLQVTPSLATSYTYWDFGGVNQTLRSDGKTATASADQATNYAAPMSLSTESYSASLSYSPWLGVTQATGANYETSSTTYDLNGRPSGSSSPYHLSGAYSSSQLYTTYSYSAQLPATQTSEQYDNGSGARPYTTTTLDGLGRTVRVESGTWTSGGQTPLSWADTVYVPCACSPLGKIQKVSQPYAPGGTPTWTSYTYDGLGRTVRAQQPDGVSATTYAYSGNQTTVTDPAAKWKTFTRDVLGNLTSVVEPDPSSTTGGTVATAYTYDWMSHVSQVAMTRAGTTQNRTFVYSDAGLPTLSTTPENGTVTYTYNSDNTLQYKHDAKGQDTVYTYDTKKRVTLVQRYPQGKANAEDLCQRVGYGYDNGYSSNNFSWTPNSSQTVYFHGRLTQELWGSQTISCIPNTPPTAYTKIFSYMPTGELAADELVVIRNGVPSTLSASAWRSGAGAVSSVTYPSWNPSSPIQPVFTYAFDAANRPVSLTESDNSVGWVQNVQYDVANRMTGLSFAVNTTTSNGVTTPVMQAESRGYNTNGQLTSIGWAGIGSLSYSFPAAGNDGQITQMADSVSGETVTYQYDVLKRLTAAGSTPMTGSSAQPWNESFQYDGFGNLNAKVLNGTTQTVAVNPQTNQLSNALYDGNGNMTAGVGATFAYDEGNRLASSAPVSGGIEYYGYSPDNKRIYHQFPNGNEEWIFYGPRGDQIGKYTLSASTGQFTPTLLNVWFGGRLVATQSVSGVNTRTTNAVLPDRLGTNRAVNARFYPYGDEISSTANDRVKFATYTRDSFTGLDYADERFYASTYGRFNTPDPYKASGGPSDPGSWNRYSYVEGDPVNANDLAQGLFFAGRSLWHPKVASRLTAAEAAARAPAPVILSPHGHGRPRCHVTD